LACSAMSPLLVFVQRSTERRLATTGGLTAALDAI
jgi:hypothetical protein